MPIWFDKLLDVAFPPICLNCKVETTTHDALCAVCFAGTERISIPFCHKCAAPLPSTEHLNQNQICIHCEVSPPKWSAARAGFVFEDVTQSLIFGLKYGDRTEVATFFARAMLRSGGDLLSHADLIAPVPLHWRRLSRRKFNQSALMAQRLRRMHGGKIEFVPDLLRRLIHTSALAQLSPVSRIEKVRNAMAVNPRYADAIQGRRIVLIDDILTTGATLSICSQQLFDAGARDVTILVATRSGKHILPFAHQIHGLIDAEN